MGRGLVAVNTAPDSENEMHGEAAQRYGFSSGLVPGVDVLAYLAHEGVEAWGPGWLAGGRLTGRLLLPVYDREAVRVEAEPNESGLVARVVGEGFDASVRATAELALLDAGPNGLTVADQVDPADFEIGVAPESGERPAASRTRLEPGTVLATQWATFHADRAQGYLDEISEPHPVFRRDGLAHPGWLLRFANWALSTTVRLGPWIHVSSDAWLLSPVRDGDTIEVRARVTDRFERKGHEFVDLTALYLVADRSVALVDHRAIWQPRRADRPT